MSVRTPVGAITSARHQSFCPPAVGRQNELSRCRTSRTCGFGEFAWRLADLGLDKLFPGLFSDAACLQEGRGDRVGDMLCGLHENGGGAGKSAVYWLETKASRPRG